MNCIIVLTYSIHSLFGSTGNNDNNKRTGMGWIWGRPIDACHFTDILVSADMYQYGQFLDYIRFQW